MYQILSHEMRLRDMAGGNLHFTIRELLGIFTTPVSAIFLFLTCLVFFSADPPKLRDYIEVWQAFALWPLAAICYLTTYFVLLGLAAHLQDRFWPHAIYLPIIGGLALVPTVCTSETLAHQMSGGIYPIVVIPNIAYYFVTVQVFEFAFIRLVIPQVRARNMDLRMIRIGARSLPVQRIRFITAQEHYVRLQLDDQQVLQRARFGDIVNALNDHEGVQPHRSWWVGRGAAPRMTRREGKPVLELQDGTLVPVARGRITEVQNWLDSNGPFAP